MRHIEEKMTSFNGVGYGQRANLQVSTGPTYKEIHLRTTNVDEGPSQVEYVRVTLNGDTIYDVTGDELKMVEAYKGLTNEAGVYVIPFADFSAKSIEGQDLTALVTLPSDNLVIEVKLGAATAQQITDGDVPAIEAYAVMGEAPVAGGRQLLPRMYSEVIAAGASGKIDFKNFTRGPRIRRMHMQSANITDLQIKRDRLVVFDLVKAENDFSLKRAALTPQTGYYHFDAIKTHFAVADMLKTAGDSFVISPTLSSAGDFTCLFETVEVV